MKKKRLFVNIHYMEIGGAERALLGLLSALDPEKVDIDLFVNQHTGEFMPLIPDYVNLLPEIAEYTCIERPMATIVKEGHWGIAMRRIMAKLQHKWYIKTIDNDSEEHYTSAFQYVADAVEGALPSLRYLGEYDLAISFLHPHNIVLNKVKAKKKICWIHTDYSTIHVNYDKELKVWGSFDYIASISEECTTAFLKRFPKLKNKIILIENILSPLLIRQLADCEDVSAEMPNEPDCVKIVSVGRFHPAKNFESIPKICAEMEHLGVNFKWYIIGYGPDKKIQEALDKYQMRHRMILLGRKSNPYPYIKACDIYAQPSRYEGKSVTVREAQILYKPVLITNYPTAKSQVNEGIDGVIVQQDSLSVAKGLYGLVKNIDLQNRIKEHLITYDYGNESGVDKIYSLMGF
jgi:hypothetical protein